MADVRDDGELKEAAENGAESKEGEIETRDQDTVKGDVEWRLK